MISSFGFNGFLKSSINLNLLFKSHDSGYYSFDTSSATFSNNYPVENKSGFCQIIVEENNTMVAQYLFYHDNISYFRIGDVSGITIIWSQWNRILGEEALTTRYTLDDLSKLFFSYDKSYFNINKYYGAPNTGSGRFWKTSVDNYFYEGYEDLVYEYKGNISGTFDIMANTEIKNDHLINGWYYVSDASGSYDLPVSGRGILKVFTSDGKYTDAESDNGYAYGVAGIRTFIFISENRGYYIGKLNKGEKAIRWSSLIASSDYVTNMNQNINTINNITTTDIVTDVRLSTPTFSDWEGISTNDITKQLGSSWVLVNTAINATLLNNTTLVGPFSDTSKFVWQFASWYRKPQMLKNGVWYDIPSI